MCILFLNQEEGVIRNQPVDFLAGPSLRKLPLVVSSQPLQPLSAHLATAEMERFLLAFPVENKGSFHHTRVWRRQKTDLVQFKEMAWVSSTVPTFSPLVQGKCLSINLRTCPTFQTHTKVYPNRVISFKHIDPSIMRGALKDYRIIWEFPPNGRPPLLGTPCSIFFRVKY